ncbi:MAG: HAD hydrolase-like protein [Planctomycetes bacterium]|nr:HAD hydrolase-like protein [Planctomycetota bacterium]
MREFKAYLFDADGTLMDTKELIYQSFAYTADQMGEKLGDKEYVVGTIGLPFATQIRMLIGDGRDDEFYTRAMSVYSEHMFSCYKDYITLFPGVREGLETLVEHGKLLALVTSRRREGLDRFMRFLDLDKFFAVVVTPEMTTAHKPSPEPAELALELLGAEAEESVFIGDADFDMVCGHDAGTATAFVSWGGNPLTSLSVKPDFIADKFADLLPE